MKTQYEKIRKRYKNAPKEETMKVIENMSTEMLRHHEKQKKKQLLQRLLKDNDNQSLLSKELDESLQDA